MSLAFALLDLVVPAAAEIEATVDCDLSAEVDQRCYDDSADRNSNNEPLSPSLCRLRHLLIR